MTFHLAPHIAPTFRAARPTVPLRAPVVPANAPVRVLRAIWHELREPILPAILGRRVGGLTFVKIGRLPASFSIAKPDAKLAKRLAKIR